MSADMKNTDKVRKTFSLVRRNVLKAGVAMAAAPFFSGVLSAVLPSKARAAEARKKKILIISASPREGGNSDSLCDEFGRGASQAGHMVEKIRLSEKNINYCTGCCSCVYDPGSCVQDDDMAEILDKLLAADVLVLASPVYFLTFNGQMKTFIDRVCPVYSRVRDTDVYFIASAAGGKRSIDSVVQGFRVFTSCLDVREKGIISITGVWDDNRTPGSPALRKAYAAGLKA